MLAGMGGVSYHQLVAAVSEAGGIGTLGASTMGDDLADEMARPSRRTPTSRSASTCSPRCPARSRPGIDAVITGGARIFVAGLGVPREAVDALHDANVLVGSMCGKVRHAVNAVASGCDFVVAQGTEAGGHTGTVATMALVPQVVDAVGEQVPGRRRRRPVRRPRPGRRAHARRRRRLGRHPLHRHARGPHGRRLQGDADRAARGRHRHLPRASPARRAASCATTGRSTSRSTPRSCSRSRPRRSPRHAPASATSATTAASRSTCAASSCRAGRASGRSTA